MPTQQDTFTDESKLNETLGTTVTGGELISDDLQLGNVLSFDGVNDYVSVPDSTGLDVGSGEMSAFAWVKCDVAGTRGIITKGDHHGSFSTVAYRLYVFSNGRIGGQVSDSGIVDATDSKYYLSANDAVSPDVWTHIGFTFSTTDNEYKFFVNGKELDPSTITKAYDGTLSGIHANTRPLYMGAYEYNGGVWTDYYEGDIAQAIVLDYALSGPQVQDLYKYGYDNAQSLQPAVSYWKLDEGSGTTATDSVGSNNGTIAGATWGDGSIYTLESRTTSDDKLGSTDTPTSITDFKYTTSKKGGGVGARMGFSQDYDTQRENVLSFDGVDDYVDATDTLASDYPFTMCAWVKTSQTTSGYIFAMQDASSFASAQTLRVNASKLYVGSRESSGGTSFAVSTTVIADGNWHHVVGTFVSDTERNAYVDGVLEDTDNTSKNFENTLIDNWSIGAERDSGGVQSQFDGEISDIRFYDDALTADEVNYLYTSGKEGTDPTTTNLVSQWLLDEGTGSTATDNAGSNNGTITSATWATNTDIAHIQSTWKNVNNDTLVRGAYSFDGVDDYISVADSADLSFGNGATDSEFSFGFWINANEANGDGLITKRDIGVTEEYEVQFSGVVADGMVFQIWDASTNGKIATKTGEAWAHIDEWAHVVVTYDASSTVGGMKTYVNGLEIPTTDVSSGSYTAMEDTGEDVVFGAFNDPSNYYGGSMSDIQLYSAELTPSEIWDIYANSKPRATNQVSRWKLNGNALDEWGANDGTVSGALPLPARANTPVVGDSLNQRSIASFDGVNDYITITNNASLNFGTGDFSIGGWVKFDSGSAFLWDNRDTVDPYAGVYLYWYTNGNLYFAIFDGDQSYPANVFSIYGTVPINDNNWHYIVGVCDRDTVMNLYLDGVLLATGDPTGHTGDISTSFDITLGSVGGISNFLLGNVANVVAYNDARMASEILTDYENGYIDESDANLVSYWPLDGDYLDWKGSNDGTNSGSTLIQAIDGPMGKRNFGHNDVLSFDGVDDFVNIDGVMSDVSSDTQGTIAAWAKTNDNAVIGAIVCIGDSGGTSEFIQFRISAGGYFHVIVFEGGSSKWTLKSTDAFINNNEWYHFAVTCDGTVNGGTMYVNGEEIAQSYTASSDTTVWFSSMPAVDTARIGALNTGVDSIFLNGAVADARFYNDALTADEVKYIYTNGDQGTDPTTTNLVSQWLLDEGTGTTATDNAGSNNGTITSATWDKALVPPMNLNNQVTMDVTSLSATDTIFVGAYMDNLIERVTAPFAFTSWEINYVSPITFIPRIIIITY